MTLLIYLFPLHAIDSLRIIIIERYLETWMFFYKVTKHCLYYKLNSNPILLNRQCMITPFPQPHYKRVCPFCHRMITIPKVRIRNFGRPETGDPLSPPNWEKERA